MKQKTFYFKSLLLLALMVLGVSNAWAEEVTYTFTSKSWEAKLSDNSVANWTSGADGNQLTSTQGVQITTATSGANATSPISFQNVSQVVVKYCTNASKGAGSIALQIGDETEKSQSITKTGGTTLRTLTYDFSPVETGNVKITVNCTTNSIYIYSVTITYSPDGGTPSQTFSYDKSTLEVTYGDSEVEWPVLTIPDGIEEVVYESTNTEVATVNNSGVVSLVKPGETTIQALANDNSEASYVLTYKKAAPELNYTIKSYTVKPNASFDTPTLTNPLNVTGIVFSSNNTEVATVHASTGDVTIGSVEGSATIRAQFNGNDYYSASYSTYTITVSDKDWSVVGQWEPVTDVDDFKAGQKYIMVSNTGQYAMTDTQNSNNRKGVAVTATDGIITLDAEATVAAIILEGTTDEWLLNTESGYLYYPGSGNYLRSTTDISENTKNAQWILSVDEIKNAETTERTVRYNPNSGSPIFSCYSTTTNAAAILYKEYIPDSRLDAGLSFGATTSFTIMQGESFDAPSLINPNNLTVEYSITGDDIAMINSTTGALSIKENAFGTATIKAISEEDEDYKAGLAHYTLTITKVFTIAEFKGLDDNETGTINLNGAQVVFKDNKDLFVRDAEAAIDLYDTGLNLNTGDILSGYITGTKTTYSNLRELKNMTENSIVVTDNSTVVATTIDPTSVDFADYECDLVKIASTEITLDNSKYYVADGALQLYDKWKVGYETETNKSVDASGIIIPFTSGGSLIYELCPRFAEDIVYLDNSVAVGISSPTGYATFCSDKALDFTAVDAIYAYIATVEGSAITFTRVTKIPANTGVLLRSTEGEAVAAVNVPVLTADADDVSANKFVPATTEIASLASEDGGNVNYILNNKNGVVGFYKANGQKVAAGKAYLQVSVSQAKDMTFIGLDDTTSIELMEAATGNEQMFNLAGQRVSNGYKGIVIVNGKKVIR